MEAKVIGVRAAANQRSGLLRRAEAGEEFVIANRGRPIARLVPYEPPRPKRMFGRLKGQIVIHGDLDSDNDEIARDFEESINRPLT
jgi:prevent-host-death family protein